MQPAFDSLALMVYNTAVAAANGAPVAVVWAQDITPWEGYEFLPDRARLLMRDSLRVLQPQLYSTLPAGQAIYFLLDWKAKRVGRLWAGPAIADRKAQWEYARAQFPERVLLYATNTTIQTEDGREIPVVYLNPRPWAERY
jgi:hypothetical protein